MMVCSKSVLSVLVIICLGCVSVCRGTSSQNAQFQGMSDEDENGVVSMGKRWLMEKENTSLTLAAERTDRKDPLNNFQHYKGGWNLSAKHYFSSVGFTSAPLLIIAATWFLGFGLCMFVTSICYCCYNRQPYGYNQTLYAVSFLYLILFTICATIGCIVLYTGQGKFHESTTHTLQYVVQQADFTVANLRNISDNLAAAKRAGIDQTFLPPNVQNNIDNVDTKINFSATTLEDKAKKNSKDINRALNFVRLALIIIAAVMLLLAVLGFVFSVLGMQFLVYILVILGWILVMVTFILCGVFLVLHNMVGDTCIAMDQWVERPMAHTAMDDILPCVDSATAQETLSETKDVTYQLINVVNTFITNVSNANFSSNNGLVYYNQSGPSVPVVCNPFNSDKTARKCDANEVALSDAAQEWRNYVCKVSETDLCTNVGRLTPAFYEQMVASVNLSYMLYHYGPFLVALQDCTFVRDTFRHISKENCPGLKRYSKWIFIGLVLTSVGVMLSLVFWVLYARERRHWAYKNQFIKISN